MPFYVDKQGVKKIVCYWHQLDKCSAEKAGKPCKYAHIKLTKSIFDKVSVPQKSRESSPSARTTKGTKDVPYCRLFLQGKCKNGDDCKHGPHLTKEALAEARKAAKKKKSEE